MPEGKENKDFRFEIKSHIGVLSENNTGWTKELNVVSWNGRKGKYDIRDWSPKHRKMSRGITMTEEEFDELAKLISNGAGEDAGMNSQEIEDDFDTGNVRSRQVGMEELSA